MTGAMDAKIPRICMGCRWLHDRKIDFYPCRECVNAHGDADYNFFCQQEQPNMFGACELAHCRSCGRRVHMTFGPRGYKYVKCRCGNSLQAKVTVEEMIRRWNNKPPSKTIMWRVAK